MKKITLNSHVSTDLLQPLNLEDYFKQKLNCFPEALKISEISRLVTTDTNHGLISTVHTAFRDHYPLILTPDMIWLCISQGFAQYLNQQTATGNKKTIKVRRDNFIKGSEENNWSDVFAEFAEQIKDNMRENYYDLICNFSTTDDVSRAVSQITLMDAVQSQFEYTLRTMCGIPSITLLGTIDDWKSLYFRTEELLSQFSELDWWKSELLLALSEFVNVFKSNINYDFWKSFYKWNQVSGGAIVSGNINCFFPYVKKSDYLGGGFEKNKFLIYKGVSSGNKKSTCGGTLYDRFPSGLSQAPFVWEYFQEKYKMKFVGGFMGTIQNPDGAVMPALGWAVMDDIQ